MRLFVFGLGYAARAVVEAARAPFLATTREGRDGTIRFDDDGAVLAGLAASTHVLSSVPPDDEGDPVLRRYEAAIAGRWLGYLSSTGVYGDTGGA